VARYIHRPRLEEASAEALERRTAMEGSWIMYLDV